MSYGQGWGGSPWGGGGAAIQAVVPVLYDVLVEDVVEATTDVFIGLQQIPVIIAGAQSRLKVEVVFSVGMSIDSNFLNPANYTITQVEGSVYIPVLSVSASGTAPLRRATLELGLELNSKDYYFLTIAPSIVSLTGDPADPNYTKFQWADMTEAVFRTPLEIPIKDFSGEVHGGILGQPDGLLFFSPALEDVSSTSTIEVEQVSACTRAYDVYEMPNPPDPTPLLTWGPGISSVTGPTSVLWATADRLGLPRMDLEYVENDNFQPAYDFNTQATLVETIDITKGGFMNDIRWGTFPATGKTVFRTAANQSPIGPGPTTQLKLDWPKLYLSDSATTTDQVIINAIDLEVAELLVIIDDVVVQNITIGTISVTVDDAILITETLKINAQYSRALATDTIVVSDSALRDKVISRTLSDTIAITDSLAIVAGVTYDVLASDTLAITEQLSLSLVYNLTATDTVTATDSNALSFQYARSASDTASITDESAALLQGDLIISDAIVISDQTAVQPFYLYSVVASDSVSITDAKTLDFYISSADSISLTDAIAVNRESDRSASDTAAITDSTSFSADYSYSVSDTLVLTDTVSATTVSMVDVVIGDTLTITDSKSIQVDKTMSTDTFTTTDSNSIEITKGVSDSVTVDEVLWTGSAVQYHDTTFSPAGLWQFNDTLNDTSGNGLHLTIEAGAVNYGEISPGVRGVILDGATTSLVYNTASATLGTLGDISIEMLINVSSYANSKNIVSYSAFPDGNTTNNSSYIIELYNASGNFTWMQESGSNTASRTSNILTRPPINQLCHFAMTRRSNVIRTYINGVLVDTSSALTTPTGGSFAKFRIATQGRGWSPAMTLASLKVVATGLTDANIATEYNRTVGRLYGEI